MNIAGMQAAFGSLSAPGGTQQPADLFALLGLGQTGAAAWSAKTLTA